MATCPACRKKYDDATLTCPDDGATLVPDTVASGEASLAAGQMIGEYQVESKLGEGGFGAVYRAVHPLIGKTAAIKVLNQQYSSNPEMVSRFIAEARAVNQIRHRNIIDIFSFGKLADGRQYYVMELLEGVTFDRYLEQQNRLAPDVAIPILQKLARALDAAHAAGIAHRDLKPENIFLSFDEDGAVFPKLLDFGIAKLLSTSGDQHKTRTGTPMGTPYYMSPEQCRGKQVDHRTDIYSFGVMTFKVLTGRLPFDADDVLGLMIKHTTDPPPLMSSVEPSLPPALDEPVRRMLEKDAALRPQSVGQAIDALAEAARGVGFVISGPGAVRANPPMSGQAQSSPGAITGPSPTPTPTHGAGHGAMAATLAADTLGSTQTSPSPDARPGMGGKLAAGALVAAVALGVVGFAATRGDSKPQAHPAADAVPVATQSASAAPSAPQVTPVASPSPAPSAAAPKTDEVALTFEGAPPNADVYQGAQKLGPASAPVSLKRGDAPVKLTLKAPGFAPRVVTVKPSADATVDGKLTKAPAGGINKDLENPF